MADKEATVYVIDVGKTMGLKHYGREESDLDWSMKYLWERITHTVSTGRKTAHIGVVGLCTDGMEKQILLMEHRSLRRELIEIGTKNKMSREPDYQHITEFQQLQQTQMGDIHNLRELIKPSSTGDGDVISAFILAVEMIRSHCKKLKYIRRIVLITNASGIIDEDDNAEIVKQVKQDNIEVTIMGVDFDDPNFGFKEEGKQPAKRHNEGILRRLAEDCNGTFTTMAKGVADLDMPIMKTVRTRVGYKGLLTLGNPREYDETALCIEVERYARIMMTKPPTASKYVVTPNYATEGIGQVSTQSSATLQHGLPGEPDKDGFAAVRSARVYQIKDDTVPGGKRDVAKEELEKGYEYGRTAVHIGESDSNIVTLETDASLSICGFVPAAKFERYFEMSKSSIVIGNKDKQKESMALSSLIHALIELESYAVARFVEKDNKAPVMVLLAPSIEAGYECLVDVELPFAEDIHSFKFPPLDKVVTVAGKNLIQHRNLPSDELMKAMSDYVDSMDLSKFGTDADGKPAEYAPPHQTYSPVPHRIQQAIRHRAIYPLDELPPPMDVIVKYTAPPKELVERSQSALNAVIKAADVKKVPPKQKGRKHTREYDKPLSGLNIEALLGSSGKRTKISADNAIPEFKQLLATTTDIAEISDAAKQMGEIVQGYIRESVGDMGYGRAVEALRVMREELMDLEEPEVFNEFVRGLKGQILKKELKGERREMWWLIKAHRLGLIDDKMSELSKVTEEKAKEFYSMQP